MASGEEDAPTNPVATDVAATKPIEAAPAGAGAAPESGESDDMFRLLVESVSDYAIFMLDPTGRITTWNSGAEKIKGYKREEIVGRDFSVFYPQEAVARRWPQLELALARERGRFEDEGWRVRKNGSRFWANVVIAPVWDSTHRLRGFAKVTRDLTARREIEQLQRSERRVNEFLAMLAHELRNPLGPIQSALDVVERQPDDPGVARWAHALIHRQVRHLARLVDDLLDVSRITRGKIELKPETVDLRALVEHVVDALQSVVDAARQQLVVTTEGPLMVRVDPTRCEQVLTNLVGNASKYTPEGGRITLRGRVLGGLASLTVSDNGIGMSADLLPRVFDLFVQGERGLDRRGGGLGVGLTLAKRLTELLGGTLTATSAGLGLGSEFTLAFPLIESPERRQPSTAAAKSAAGQSRRVLIVDDNQDAAEALAALVEILGHEATVLHDGRAALELAPSKQPDFILLDIGLPGMNGIEVAQLLRKMPALHRTRLIACTGYGRDENSQKIGDGGFDRHLVKPVTASDLEQILGA